MGMAPISPLMPHTSNQPLHPALLPPQWLWDGYPGSTRPLQRPTQAGSIFAFDLQAFPPPR